MVYGQEEGPCVNLGSNGTQHVGLTPDNDPPKDVLDQGGSQYIYQYAHELAHILSNHEEAAQSRFGWFGETLSELASLHALRANGRHSYADQQITTHVTERANISDFDASGRVSEWYPEAIVRLGKDSTIRELNGAIACELLPYFENDPGLWESVTHISKWNRRSDDFRGYLDNWKQRLLSEGAHSGAPEVVRAVLYGEGNVREPLSVCGRFGDAVPELEGEGEGGEGVAASSSADPEGVLRESLGEYDREIARERVAMSSSGQGMAAGTDSGIGGPSNPGGAMVTIPSAVTPAMPAGATDGTGSAGGGSSGESTAEGVAGSSSTDPRFEIPEDIAEVTGNEDQVARQIREAAEQEENPRIREALWEEYRKQMELRSR